MKETYYSRNREAKLAKGREYYQVNIEAKREYARNWGRANRASRSLYQKQYTATRREQTLLNSARRRAKQKRFEFSIALEHISIPEYCPYLGIRLENGIGGGCKDSSPTLDRINSLKGYVPGNVEVISGRANRLKNDGTAQELRAIADRLEALTRNRYAA